MRINKYRLMRKHILLPISVKVFIILVLYKIVLDYVATNALVVFNEKLIPQDNLSNIIISWVLYLVQIGVISYGTKKITLSKILYLFLFIVNGVGYFTIYGRNAGVNLKFFLLVNSFWMIFWCAVCIGGKGIMRYDVNNQPIHKNELYFFMLVAALSILISGVYGNFRFGIAFSDVYEYRMALNMPVMMGYLFRFCSAVFLPYLFVRFLINKKIFYLFITAILAILLYSVDGLKTNIVLYASIILISILYKRVQNKRQNVIDIIVSFVFLLVLFMSVNYIGYITSGEYLFLDEVYRVFLIPDMISNNYYTFISEREALLWRESILRMFFDSPYPTSINFLVSSTVTEHGRAVANTGMIGDAYANFKSIGICIYPLLYAFVIHIWQKINDNRIDIMTIGVGFILIWNAINISFFTWLLTGGVIVYFIISLMFKGRSRCR